MPKTYMVTEYTNEDIMALDNIPLSDVLEILKKIKRGYLPTNYTFLDENPDRTISEDEYEATKLHCAINIAIDLVKQEMSRK